MTNVVELGQYVPSHELQKIRDLADRMERITAMLPEGDEKRRLQKESNKLTNRIRKELEQARRIETGNQNNG